MPVFSVDYEINELKELQELQVLPNDAVAKTVKNIDRSGEKPMANLRPVQRMTHCKSSTRAWTSHSELRRPSLMSPCKGLLLEDGVQTFAGFCFAQ